MTSSNVNIFRVTGHLCGEFTGPGEFPDKGQWRGALMFSLISVWINDWVNNREAGDFRRYRAHYGVTVMEIKCSKELSGLCNRCRGADSMQMTLTNRSRCCSWRHGEGTKINGPVNCPQNEEIHSWLLHSKTKDILFLLLFEAWILHSKLWIHWAKAFLNNLETPFTDND